jgi:hypothetical protein
MKAILRTTIKTTLKIYLFVAFAGIGGAHAVEPHQSGAGKVCAVLRSFEGETQIFDYTRTHVGDAAFGVKLHCGDWVSVDKGKATIELTVGAGVLAGENTFFQIMDPQSGNNPEAAHLALYRGEFVAQPTKGEIRIVTPNAVGRVSKGGAFVVYSGDSEETQIVGLGGKTTLENRFFPDRRMSAGFAQVVTFANPVERLIPDQGRFVNARDLNERLAFLGVPAAVRASLEKAVKAGVKTKLPVTLATTARPPRTSAPRLEGGGEFASRAPASVPVVEKRKAVVRKRPASREPNFALKHQDREKSERKRLLQALATMRPDDDAR